MLSLLINKHMTKKCKKINTNPLHSYHIKYLCINRLVNNRVCCVFNHLLNEEMKNIPFFKIND